MSRVPPPSNGLSRSIDRALAALETPLGRARANESLGGDLVGDPLPIEALVAAFEELRRRTLR